MPHIALAKWPFLMASTACESGMGELLFSIAAQLNLQSYGKARK
jgi:hypothetical protein